MFSPAGSAVLTCLSRNSAIRACAAAMPFAIGTSERDQWVACMALAMEDGGIDAGLRDHLMKSFFNTADFMRNREG